MLVQNMAKRKKLYLEIESVHTPDIDSILLTDAFFTACLV